MNSEQIEKLAMALAKAQGEITVAHKETYNGFHKSKYSDLASCWDACRTALSQNELSVVQYPGNSEPNYLNLITLLLHSSGQWIKGSIRMKLQTRKKDHGWVDSTDPQTYGVTMTYARRYGLMAMVGIAPGDSDGEPVIQIGNGNSHGEPTKDKIKTEEEKKALSREIPPITHDKFATSEQATEYRKECFRLKIPTSKMKDELKKHGITMPDNIPADQFDARFNELKFIANVEMEEVSV